MAMMAEEHAEIEGELRAEIAALKEVVAIQARDYVKALAELQAEIDRLRAELGTCHDVHYKRFIGGRLVRMGRNREEPCPEEQP